MKEYRTHKVFLCIAILLSRSVDCGQRVNVAAEIAAGLSVNINRPGAVGYNNISHGLIPQIPQPMSEPPPQDGFMHLMNQEYRGDMNTAQPYPHPNVAVSYPPAGFPVHQYPPNFANPPGQFANMNSMQPFQYNQYPYQNTPAGLSNTLHGPPLNFHPNQFAQSIPTTAPPPIQQQYAYHGIPPTPPTPPTPPRTIDPNNRRLTFSGNPVIVAGGHHFMLIRTHKCDTCHGWVRKPHVIPRCRECPPAQVPPSDIQDTRTAIYSAVHGGTAEYPSPNSSQSSNIIPDVAGTAYQGNSFSEVPNNCENIQIPSNDDGILNNPQIPGAVANSSSAVNFPVAHVPHPMPTGNRLTLNPPIEESHKSVIGASNRRLMKPAFKSPTLSTTANPGIQSGTDVPMARTTQSSEMPRPQFTEVAANSMMPLNDDKKFDQNTSIASRNSASSVASANTCIEPKIEYGNLNHTKGQGNFSELGASQHPSTSRGDKSVSEGGWGTDLPEEKRYPRPNQPSSTIELDPSMCNPQSTDIRPKSTVNVERQDNVTTAHSVNKKHPGHSTDGEKFTISSETEFPALPTSTEQNHSIPTSTEQNHSIWQNHHSGLTIEDEAKVDTAVSTHTLSTGTASKVQLGNVEQPLTNAEQARCYSTSYKFWSKVMELQRQLPGERRTIEEASPGITKFEVIMAGEKKIRDEDLYFQSKDDRPILPTWIAEKYLNHSDYDKRYTQIRVAATTKSLRERVTRALNLRNQRLERSILKIKLDGSPSIPPSVNDCISEMRKHKTVPDIGLFLLSALDGHISIEDRLRSANYPMLSEAARFYSKKREIYKRPSACLSALWSDGSGLVQANYIVAINERLDKLKNVVSGKEGLYGASYIIDFFKHYSMFQEKIPEAMELYMLYDLLDNLSEHAEQRFYTTGDVSYNRIAELALIKKEFPPITKQHQLGITNALEFLTVVFESLDANYSPTPKDVDPLIDYVEGKFDFNLMFFPKLYKHYEELVATGKLVLKSSNWKPPYFKDRDRSPDALFLLASYYNAIASGLFDARHRLLSCVAIDDPRHCHKHLFNKDGIDENPRHRLQPETLFVLAERSFKWPGIIFFPDIPFPRLFVKDWVDLSERIADDVITIQGNVYKTYSKASMLKNKMGKHDQCCDRMLSLLTSRQISLPKRPLLVNPIYLYLGYEVEILLVSKRDQFTDILLDLSKKSRELAADLWDQYSEITDATTFERAEGLYELLINYCAGLQELAVYVYNTSNTDIKDCYATNDSRKHLTSKSMLEDPGFKNAGFSPLLDYLAPLMMVNNNI